MVVTDDELQRLADDLESDRVERKAGLSDPKKIREAICAFANDLPDYRLPGLVFVGLFDDGAPSGLAITDSLLQNLAQMRSDGNILPLPAMTVSKRTIKGHDVGVIEVQPSPDPPVRFKGRPWVRIGPTMAVASAQDERRLSERRRSSDLPFDHRPVPEASLDDLDLDFFEREYLPNAVAPDVLEANDRTPEQQLRGLRWLSPDGKPNVAALLVLGKNPRDWVPGSYVQFLRVGGTDLTGPILDHKEIDGSLVEIVRRAEEVLTANVAVAVDVRDGTTDERTPDIPLVALQQFLRNALIHRTYEFTNAPVRITWFPDRVEIQSPGGLYGLVNPQNIQQGATDYRNPLLAEAMKVLGFVQRFGMGLPLARGELARNRNPEPEFTFEPTGVLVTVRRR